MDSANERAHHETAVARVVSGILRIFAAGDCVHGNCVTRATRTREYVPDTGKMWM
jgi:hypothetical protein